MYKFFAVAIFFLCATSVHAEEITGFNSVLNVKNDGTVLVTETILYDFGVGQLHGIFRTLQKRHPQESTVWYKKRSIDIEILDVEKNGIDEPYQITDTGSEIEVKIGDPDITITGLHIYTITYNLTGALSYGPLGSELYYNVTGDNWLVPITKAKAIVVDTTGILLASSSDCYVGVYGDVTRCIKGIHTATSTVFTTGLLTPGSGLTIAQELNANKVEVLINEEVSISWIGYILGVLWLLGLSIWAYRFRTQFKSNKPIIAQYEPYEGILPMYTGVLFDGKLDPQDITAGIVYLAEQGYIKIKKTEEKILWVFNTSDYEITLLRSMSEVTDDYLKVLCEMLFTGGSALPQTQLLSNLAKNPKGNFKMIQRIKGYFAHDLQTQGFLSTVQWQRDTASVFSNAGFAFLLLIPIWLFAPSFFNTVGPLLTVVCVFGFIGLIFLLVILLSPRLTIKGYEARNYLQGFKLFLSVTEKERYTFFNAPEKSPELFMKYLPYAIAFKVEKEWSKVFEGITMPNPSWYEGSHLGAFSAVAFSSDIGAFSSSFASSSGVSGSSGGGSSGGGGGGGGGGSW